MNGYFYNIAKKMMPKISETERAALNAGTGTIGIENNLSFEIDEVNIVH